MLHRLEVGRDVEDAAGVVLDELDGEALADLNHRHALAPVDLKHALQKNLRMKKIHGGRMLRNRIIIFFAILVCQ